MKLSKLNKKAAMSHVEVMISFLIFAGGVTFVLFAINPFKISPLLPALIDTVDEGIDSYAGIDLEYVPFVMSVLIT